MSDGATMSAPATACDSAAWARCIDGDVVDDLVTLDDAAVAVRRVLAQADIGDDDEILDLALQCANGALHWRVRIGRGGSVGVLLGGQTKEQNRRNALGLRGGSFLNGLVD